MAHLDSFLAYHNLPEVVRYQSWEPFSRAEAEAFVREQMAQPLLAQGKWTQIALSLVDGPHIGDVAVHVHADDSRLCELGITIAPDYQGQGYAREALKAVIEHLVRARGVHRVTAEIDPRNRASLALFERLEFTREGLLRQNEWIKGEWVDTVVYGLLASDLAGREGSPQ